MVSNAYPPFYSLGMGNRPSDAALVNIVAELQALMTEMSAVSVPFNSAGVAINLTNDQLFLGTAASGLNSVVPVAVPSKGTVTFSVSNNVATATYIPAPGQTDDDHFTFKAKNGTLETSARRVKLNIAAPADPVVPSFTVNNIAADSAGINIEATIRGGYANIVTLPSNRSTGLKIDGQFRGQDLGQGRVTILSIPPDGIGNVTFRYVPAVGGFGQDSFSYSVKANVAGAVVVTGTITLNVPAVAASSAQATLDVPVNTTGRVDLAPRMAGSGLTGARIVSSPRHGKASMNGFVLSYTPRPDYFGSDEIQVAAFGFLGESAPSRVLVTVTGRADPRHNVQVQGLLAAQVGSAWRFADAQMDNINRRLDVLRRAAPVVPKPARASAPGAHPSVATAGDAQLPDWSAAEPSQGWQADTNRDTNPAAPGSPVQVQAWLPAAIRLAQTGQLPVAGLVPQSLSSGAESSSGLMVWADGAVSLGRDPAGGGGPLARFRSDGVTLGVDRRWGAHGLAGVAVGWGQERSHWGDQGSTMQARATSVAAYAQWRGADPWVLDAQGGHSQLNSDARRWSEGAQALASVRRAAAMNFASMQISRELQGDILQGSPYARLQWARVRWDDASESAVGPHALTYLSQASWRRQVAWGLRLNSRHESINGLFTPYLRIEARHGSPGSDASSLRYADQSAASLYSLTDTKDNAKALNAALGFDYMGHSGLNLGLELAQLRAAGGLTQQTWRLQLSQLLDGKPQRGSAVERPAKAKNISVQLSALDDRNVSRGRDAADRVADQGWLLNLVREKTFDSGGRLLKMVYWGGGVESWARTTRLSRAVAKLGGELRFRNSGAFDEATYAVFGQVAGEEYVSALRDGWRAELGASVLKPLTDRLTGQIRGSLNRRDARSQVFSGSDHALSLSLDYLLDTRHLLYASLEWRRGDEVSSGRPALDQLDAAQVLVADDAYTAQSFTSYRLDASTKALVLGWNVRLTDEHSFDLSWTFAQSRGLLDVSSAMAARSNRYTTQQLRASVLMRY